MIELLELKNKVLEIFDTDIDHLGDALMQSVTENDIDKYGRFCELVDGDLSADWLQRIYQYYHADRENKKQDYTPKCLADFMGRLVGESDVIIDMCAGSGALIIQKWLQNPEQKFIAFEIDSNVIPFLLFNLAVRNIRSTVYRGDVLNGERFEQWKISRGERYGNISYFKPSV